MLKRSDIHEDLIFGCSIIEVIKSSNRHHLSDIQLFMKAFSLRFVKVPMPKCSFGEAFFAQNTRAKKMLNESELVLGVLI